MQSWDDPVFLVGAARAGRLRVVEGARSRVELGSAGVATRPGYPSRPRGTDVECLRDPAKKKKKEIEVRRSRRGPVVSTELFTGPPVAGLIEGAGVPHSGDRGYTILLKKTVIKSTHTNKPAASPVLAQEKLAKDVVILDTAAGVHLHRLFRHLLGANPSQTKAIWDEVTHS